MDLSVGILIKVIKDQLAGWIKDARTGLDGLGKEAGETGGALDAGLAKGATGAKTLRDGVESISDQLSNLRNFAAGFAIFDQVIGQAGEIARLADEYKNLTGRMQIAVGEHGDVGAAMEDVRAIANATGAEMGATGALYSKLAQSSKELGLSQADIARVTETVSQAFVVSGASAGEAAGGIRQLSQALASGVLRGDEFNSIMENSPRLAQALSDALGVTTGQLRKMAEEGTLTAQAVVEALQSQAGAIEADFAKMPDTVGRATQRLANEWTVFIGELDKTSGASTQVAGVLNSVAGNLDQVAAAATLAGEAVLAGFAGKAGAALINYGQGLMAAKAATLASATASQQSAAASNWAALAAEKVAAAELARAKATQSATGAVLAEMEATRAAAQQAAIYGAQRAAVERDVAAARAANARAMQAVASAEAGLLAAQKAGIVAAGALATETVAKTGIMASAWGGVKTAAASVAAAIRAIPTGVKIGIVFVGWEAAVAGAKWLGETLAKLSPEAKSAEAAQRKHNEAMAAAAGAAASTALALSEYQDVALQVRDNVLRLSDAERARYETSLLKSRESWLAVAKEQTALLELETLNEGQRKAAEAAKEESLKHLSAINASLDDVRAGAALTKYALANLMDRGAAVLVKEFTDQVVALRAKGTPAAESVRKALADMAKSLEPGNVANVRAFGQALEDLKNKGVITAQQVSAEWGQAIAKMGGEDLQKFVITAQAAFAQGDLSAHALATTLDQVLRRAIANTGADFDLITRGISKAANDSIQNFEVIKDNLKTLADKGADTGLALAAGITSGLKSADSLAALKYWDEQIQQLGANGALSVGQLKTATDSAAAAFVKYANDAIQANGGVVDGTLRAAAEMRGYSVAVDEHGKVHLKTFRDILKITDEVINAERAMASQASELAAAQAAMLSTSIGSLQGSVDDFHAHLQAMGAAAGSFYNQTHAQMFALSKEAEEVYTWWATGAARHAASISEYYAMVSSASERVRDKFSDAMAGVKTWTDKLSSSAANVADLTHAMNFLTHGTQDTYARMSLLSDEQLAPLRAAITDAQNRMRELRDAASDTLSTIQDEWDQLNNNLDEIEQRRQDKRRAEIEAQLAAARRAGDKESVADLERALQLLKNITAARIADAKAREDEARAARQSAVPVPAGSAGASGQGGGNTSHTVTIALPSGKYGTVNTASAADAASLTDLLKQLNSDMARAT